MGIRGQKSHCNNEALEKVRWYSEHYQDVGDKVPTVVGLARQLGITKKTIHHWIAEANSDAECFDKEIKSEFADLVESMGDEHERALINNGLDGTYAHPIVKMLLVRHGYTDKIELAGDPEKPLKHDVIMTPMEAYKKLIDE